MIKPWTYPYQWWEYFIQNSGNRKKRRIQDGKWEKIALEKQKDWSFIIESNNNLILITDREHFHILDTENPNANKNKTHNYWIEIDTEVIADFIREIDSVKKYCWSNIYTWEPLKEPNDIYIFIDIFSDREDGEWTRRALWSIRIINKPNQDDKILYTINELIINKLEHISSDNIIQIKTSNSPVLLKHWKSYLVQDYEITYRKS